MTEDEHPEPVELEVADETEEHPSPVELEPNEVEEVTQPQVPITREQMALLVRRLKRKIIKEEQREIRVKKDRKKKKNLKKQRKHAKNRGR